MVRFVFISIIIAVVSCSMRKELVHSDDHKTKIKLEKSPQRAGVPSLGKEYLVNGDFVDSGFPMIEGMNVFSETRSDSDIFPFTQIKSESGIQMIAPNCFQCHADSLNGQYVLGLGNTRFDFTIDMSFATQFLKNTVTSKYGVESSEWKAAFPFIRAMEATAPHLQTEVVGVNPADKLAAVLAAYRNPDDLSWRTDPALPIPDEVVPADPPAWWLLKKKNAMFTTAVGRGDFARLMMASSLLTLQDTVKAREVDNHFTDVLSFINTIEAPKYPYDINHELSLTGKLIFNENCSSCHGTYGDNGEYPNLLVDISLVKTDSLLAISNFAYTEFVNWYNDSWFSKGQYKAFLKPGHGYVAPPLDGVWATAPYFHNASVPTIDQVLNSHDRPSFWTKSMNSYDYDFEKLGWKHRKFDQKMDKYTYDTTVPGYGNEGHYFGDKLSELERKALIEYLKTL